MSASLSGDLPGHSWWQATTGVTCGGLGLRTALGAALPAFVASRIMCRSLVSTMVGHFSLASGTPSQPIMAKYDARTDAALARLVSTLWVSLMKPWRNGSSFGTCPLHLPGTLAASLRTMVMETTGSLGAQAFEYPGSHRRLRAYGCPSGAASDA